MHNNEEKKESDNESPVLPVNTVPLENQVAGHVFGQSIFGILRDCVTDDILKPLHSRDKRGRRELGFYKDIWDQKNDKDEAIVKLRNFIPDFHGVAKIGSIDYLLLSNITSGFDRPSIMDVKIGIKTYDPEASQDKIQSEINKYLWAEQIGFRILGMRVYQSNKNNCIIKDKNFGKELEPEEIVDAIRLFVDNNKTLVNLYLNQINAIKEWFQNYNINKWKFISSSLLMVHSVDPIQLTVKIIDFAHVFPNSNGQDENYLFGLNKLIEYFDKLNSEI